MFRFATFVFCFIAFQLCTVTLAVGQDVREPPRLQPNRLPTTSPYLLLGNNRFDPALSYYRIIRPENQVRSAYSRQNNQLLQLRNQVNRQQERLDQAGSSMLNTTGHRAVFQNYGSYFNTNLRGSSYFGSR